MSLKELAIAGPELSRVPNFSRSSKVAEWIWQDEFDNRDSVFAKIGPEDDDRLKELLAWVEWAEDTDTAQFIHALFHLAEKRHYILEHGESKWAEAAAELEAYVVSEAPKYPKVTAIYSVDSAIQGFWT